MILHSCGVLQYNSRSARAGFVVLLAVDCVKGWVRPRPSLLRGMLHHNKGDLLFSLFKGLPALPAPIIAPVHEKEKKKKHQKFKWMVMEHINILLRLWCWWLLEAKSTGRTTLRGNYPSAVWLSHCLYVSFNILGSKNNCLSMLLMLHNAELVFSFLNSRGHSSLLPCGSLRSEACNSQTHRGLHGKVQSYTHAGSFICSVTCTHVIKHETNSSPPYMLCAHKSLHTLQHSNPACNGNSRTACLVVVVVCVIQEPLLRCLWPQWSFIPGSCRWLTQGLCVSFLLAWRDGILSFHASYTH